MIRVNYGDIQKLGQLAVEAGRAEGAIREQAMAQQERESQRAASVQMASIAAATQRQIREIQHENDMVEFRSWLDQEAEKRTRAWEIEKMELQARNRFDLEEQEFSLRKQSAALEELQQEQERKRKITALDKLFEDGEITEADHRQEKIRLTLDLPATGGSPFVETRGTDAIGEMIAAKMKQSLGMGESASATKETVKSATTDTTKAAVYDLSLPPETRTQISLMSQLSVDSGTRAEINAVVATKNPELIKQAYTTLRSKVTELAEKTTQKTAQGQKQAETKRRLTVMMGGSGSNWPGRSYLTAATNK